MRSKWSVILPGLILLMAACAGPVAEPQPPAVAATTPVVAAEPTAAVVEPTAAPEPTATAVEPTVAPEPTATPVEPAAIAVNPTAIAKLTADAKESAPPDPGFSLTADGYYVRGRADAPVVIDDYSDFL